MRSSPSQTPALETHLTVIIACVENHPAFLGNKTNAGHLLCHRRPPRREGDPACAQTMHN